jgi:hypothetical protein
MNSDLQTLLRLQVHPRESWSRNYLAALNALSVQGGKLMDWPPGTNARDGHRRLPNGTRIFASGSFSLINGLARLRLVFSDTSSGGVDHNWNHNW